MILRRDAKLYDFKGGYWQNYDNIGTDSGIITYFTAKQFATREQFIRTRLECREQFIRTRLECFDVVEIILCGMIFKKSYHKWKEFALTFPGWPNLPRGIDEVLLLPQHRDFVLLNLDFFSKKEIFSFEFGNLIDHDFILP